MSSTSHFRLLYIESLGYLLPLVAYGVSRALVKSESLTLSFISEKQSLVLTFFYKEKSALVLSLTFPFVLAIKKIFTPVYFRTPIAFICCKHQICNVKRASNCKCNCSSLFVVNFVGSLMESHTEEFCFGYTCHKWLIDH